MTIELQIRRKDESVNLSVNPAFGLALPVLKTAWLMNGTDCVVTSGQDGQHSIHSAHYLGNALDLRINNLIGIMPLKFAHALSSALVEVCGPEFFVVLEADHIHLEFAPPGQEPNIKGYRKGISFYEKASI